MRDGWKPVSLWSIVGYHPDHDPRTPYGTRRSALGGPSVGGGLRRRHSGPQGCLDRRRSPPRFRGHRWWQPIGLLTYDAAVPLDHELEFELPLGGTVRFDRDSP